MRRSVPALVTTMVVLATTPLLGTATASSAAAVPVHGPPQTASSLTASVTFNGDPRDQATISGTAQADAEVVAFLADGTDLGHTTADTAGQWSTPLTAPDAGGRVDIGIAAQNTDGTVEQTSTTVDFGAAVAITSPSNGAVHPGGRLELSGTGEAGATVYLLRADALLTTGTVQPDGTWTLRTTLGSVDTDLRVLQVSRGANRTSADVRIIAATAPPLVLDSPADGATVSAPSGNVTFRGAAAAGAVVSVLDAGQVELARTTVGSSGAWTLTAQVGRGHRTVTVVSDGTNGSPSRIVRNLVVLPLPTGGLQLSSPTSGSTFTPGTVVQFTGRGVPYATITVAPQGGLSAVTTTVDAAGDWSVGRYLGNGRYDFTIGQVASGATTTLPTVTLVPAATDKPFAVTAPTSGSSIRNAVAVFTGTGTAGASVTLSVTNFTASDVTTQIRTDGTWRIERYVGDGPYAFDLVQRDQGAITGATRGFLLNQAPAGVDRPFAVTAPVDGARFVANTQVEFTGTGAAGATITVDPGHGLAQVSTVVRQDGTWSVRKFLGNGPYSFSISSTGSTTPVSIGISPGA